MSAKITSPPLKWHGGKHYLARRIVALFPAHLHYVEPYFGGGAVLLERDPNDEMLWLNNERGVSEVVNDKNNVLINFWKCLKYDVSYAAFLRKIEATPLARQEYEEAWREVKLFGRHALKIVNVDAAVAFFIACRQSRAGTFTGFTSITRNRVRRGVNGNASEWLSAVDGLPAVHARLQPVVIECMDALELIRREDGQGTLFYLDPPYLQETRVSKGSYGVIDAGCEMTQEQHGELLDTLKQIKGKFILSGYRSALYDQAAAKWRREDIVIANHAAGGANKRRMIECLWMNF